MNIYSALVKITLAPNGFQPTDGQIVGGPCTRAFISKPVDTSPEPIDGMFTGNGETIMVNLPDGFVGQVQINYQLLDPNFDLIGVAFMPARNDIERREFRTIAVNFSPTGSLVTVNDSCKKAANSIAFTYGILVQETASGLIGVIDPVIDTDNDD